MRRFVILGATGSIGTQVLDLVKKEEVLGISIGNNLERGREIIAKFQPQYVCLLKEEDKEAFKEFKDITFYFGDEGLVKLASLDEEVSVIVSVVGIAGLKPTIAAIKKKHNVLLANKETLVVGGDFVMKLAKENGVSIVPIDSEHSAILQALKGEKRKDVKRLILTASGGKYLNTPVEELENVTSTEALSHPNWKMGNKITIDCQTMMNKGFEVIEAHHLFSIDYENIDVVIHPESVIHSMVEYKDSSVIAELGNPDMHMPILYALNYPNGRLEYNNQLNLIGKKLSFFDVDEEKFPCFYLALEAAKKGNIYPCVLNGANEAAVALFLENKIKLNDIYRIVREEIDNTKAISNLQLEDLYRVDREVKERIYKKFGVM